MENGGVLAMNSSGAAECNDSSTPDCGYVVDETLYDYYASLMLLVTGLPHTCKTILIVLCTSTTDSFQRGLLAAGDTERSSSSM